MTPQEELLRLEKISRSIEIEAALLAADIRRFGLSVEKITKGIKVIVVDDTPPF